MATFTEVLTPNADGTPTDWTPSSPGDHFALVDEPIDSPVLSDFLGGGGTGLTEKLGFKSPETPNIAVVTAITFTLYAEAAMVLKTSLRPFISGAPAAGILSHNIGVIGYYAYTFTGLSLSESDMASLEMEMVANSPSGLAYVYTVSAEITGVKSALVNVRVDRETEDVATLIENAEVAVDREPSAVAVLVEDGNVQTDREPEDVEVVEN